jgi:hypothetical protein
VRLSDFWERMTAVFGADYVSSWSRDTVLPELGCTVEEAIARGVETREIWVAVCANTKVPSTLA